MSRRRQCMGGSPLECFGCSEPCKGLSLAKKDDAIYGDKCITSWYGVKEDRYGNLSYVHRE